MTEEYVYPDFTVVLQKDYIATEQRFETTAVQLRGTEFGFEFSCPVCNGKIRIEEDVFTIRMHNGKLSLSPAVACRHKISQRPCQWRAFIRNSQFHHV